MANALVRAAGASSMTMGGSVLKFMVDDVVCDGSSVAGLPLKLTGGDVDVSVTGSTLEMLNRMTTSVNAVRTAALNDETPMVNLCESDYCVNWGRPNRHTEPGQI